MARVTVERALEKCESRFELVVLSAYRAHAISNTGLAAVDCTNKSVVTALREFENGKINVEELRNVVINKYALEKQTNVASDSFIADDNSVTFDDAPVTDDNNNVVGVKHANLDIASDYFA